MEVPRSVKESDPARERAAHDLLASLYKEVHSPVPPAAEEFRPAAEALSEWSAKDESGAGRLEATLGLMLADRAATLSPLAGTAWLRRKGARTALPLSASTETEADALVLLEQGARAELRLADASSLVLAEGSQLVVGDRKRSGGEAASLLRGRVYASVTKGQTTPFRVRTPRGHVSVKGTEFDLEVTGESHVRLLVTEGGVEFEYPDGSETPRRTELARWQELSLDGNQMTVKTLDPGAARERTAWARQRSHRPRRGLVAFGILAAVLLLVLAFFSTRRGLDRLADPLAGRALVATGDKTPFDSRPLLAGGTAWTAQVDVDFRRGGAWDPSSRFVLRNRVDPGGGDGWIKVAAVIERATGYSADGVEFAEDSPFNYHRWLRGKKFAYWVRHGGEVGRVEGLDDDHGNIAVPLFGVFMTQWEPNLLAADRKVAVGETWKRQVAGGIPGHPAASYSFETTARLAGYSLLDGRRIARIEFETKSAQRGMEFPDGDGDGVVRMIRMSEQIGVEKGELLVDAASGRALRRFATAETRISGSRATIVDGIERDVAPMSLPPMAWRSTVVYRYE